MTFLTYCLEHIVQCNAAMKGYFSLVSIFYYVIIYVKIENHLLFFHCFLYLKDFN